MYNTTSMLCSSILACDTWDLNLVNIFTWEARQPATIWHMHSLARYVDIDPCSEFPVCQTYPMGASKVMSWKKLIRMLSTNMHLQQKINIVYTWSYGMHMSNSQQWSFPRNGMHCYIYLHSSVQFWICDDQLRDSKLPPSRLHQRATPTSLDPGWCGAVDGAVWVDGAFPNKLLLPHGFK